MDYFSDDDRRRVPVKGVATSRLLDLFCYGAFFRASKNFVAGNLVHVLTRRINVLRFDVGVFPFTDVSRTTAIVIGIVRFVELFFLFLLVRVVILEF